MSGPWRTPDAESVDLYPKLCVHDGRVSGSITVGQSRLPLWCLIGDAIHEDWSVVEDNWSPTASYGFTASDLASFLGNLTDLRGEFARLLLVLADAERLDRATGNPWWRVKRHRKRVGDQLRRCLTTVEEPK